MELLLRKQQLALSEAKKRKSGAKEEEDEEDDGEDEDNEKDEGNEGPEDDDDDDDDDVVPPRRGRRKGPKAKAAAKPKPKAKGKAKAKAKAGAKSRAKQNTEGVGEELETNALKTKTGEATEKNQKGNKRKKSTDDTGDGKVTFAKRAKPLTWPEKWTSIRDAYMQFIKNKVQLQVWAEDLGQSKCFIFFDILTQPITRFPLKRVLGVNWVRARAKRASIGDIFGARARADPFHPEDITH